jgi:hypothetical protein
MHKLTGAQVSECYARSLHALLDLGMLAGVSKRRVKLRDDSGKFDDVFDARFSGSLDVWFSQGRLTNRKK